MVDMPEFWINDAFLFMIMFNLKAYNSKANIMICWSKFDLIRDSMPALVPWKFQDDLIKTKFSIKQGITWAF